MADREGDWAESKESELALRTLAEAVRQASASIVITNRKGDIEYVNLAFTATTGYTPEEVIGRNPRFLKSGQTSPETYREMWTRITSGETWQGELCNRRKNGELFWERAVVSPVRDAAGEITSFIASKLDVTDQRRAEDDLLAAQHRLEHVVSSSPAVLFSLAVQEGWFAPTWISHNIERLLGYAPAEVDADWWESNLHPVDREKALSEVARLFALDYVDQEYRFRSKDGVYRWLRAELRLLRDDTGKPVEAVGSWTDVTARKEAELKLHESETQYRLLFESNPFPMAVVDQDTLAFLAVNDAAVRHYGYSRKEFMQLALRDVRAPEDVPAVSRDYDRSAMERGALEHRLPETRRQRKKDGTTFDAEVARSPIVFRGRPAWMTCTFDVTEKRSMEAQLLQAQKIECMGRLAGGVAHDFNNLLGVIIGYGELLARRTAAQPQLGRYVDDIVKAARSAAGVTRQLLAFSRKQVLQPRILDLNGVVGETGRMLKRLIGEDIELVTVLEEHLGAVTADPGQMDQVLMNLAINARDAMPRGGRLTIETANVDLDQTCARMHPGVEPGRYAMIAVSDTGHGMTPDVRDRIFEPFFTTKEVGKGTGLGLATVHGIVAQSGGHIWVYSEPGQGTVFKIYLPRADGPADRTEPSVVADAELPRGTETILVVEDDTELRALVRECLESAGYSVLEACHGAEAVQICERRGGALELVLTDVVMPGMSGHEALERMRAFCPDARTIYMSGYTDDAVAIQAALADGVAFLQKPFTPHTLAQRVREVLDEAKGEAAETNRPGAWCEGLWRPPGARAHRGSGGAHEPAVPDRVPRAPSPGSGRRLA